MARTARTESRLAMKRRGAGEGHIKKITLRSGKTAWRGWLTVDYRENGTPIRRTAQCSTRSAVVERIAQLREKYRVGIDLDAERMRLDTLFEKWLAHFIATASPKKSTPVTYQWGINRVKEQMGNPVVARVSAMELQECVTALGAELKPESLNIIRAVISGAFKQAQLWKIRPDNPAQGLKLPKGKEAEVIRRILSPEEAQQLLNALQAERLGLAVAFTYALGIRPGEAAALREEDINLDAGTVTITATHNRVRGAVEREKPKSERGSRTIPLPPELRPWVIKHLAQLHDEWDALGLSCPEGLLFTGEHGGRLTHQQIAIVSRRVAKTTGVGDVTPRILRRSMLSHLAACGVDAKVRAALGGHTTAITETHYREVDPAEKTAAMGHISSVLSQLLIEDREDK